MAYAVGLALGVLFIAVFSLLLTVGIDWFEDTRRARRYNRFRKF